MDITVLGAHHLETSSSWLTCLLVGRTLALDAGSLSSGLTLEQQKAVEAVLITHHHFDHARDLPLIGLATGRETTKQVCAPESTLKFLRSHLFDGDIYPRMDEWPSVDRPAFRLVPMEPMRQIEVAGYRVKAIPVKHGTVHAVGYEVVSPDGGTLFYAGDTGGELWSCWQHTSPRLIALEVSFPDRLEENARRAGHLTPSLLEQEMAEFKRLKGYVPSVLVVHMNPVMEAEIATELARAGKSLGATITPGRRHLTLKV